MVLAIKNLLLHDVSGFTIKQKRQHHHLSHHYPTSSKINSSTQHFQQMWQK